MPNWTKKANKLRKNKTESRETVIRYLYYPVFNQNLLDTKVWLVGEGEEEEVDRNSFSLSLDLAVGFSGQRKASNKLL